MMSMNLLLPHTTDPVVWRGPIIAGAVEQFWTDVIWDDVDYMFVDMPPGTGDVPLTVFQSLPVNGVVVVTSPQELVGMIVEKAVNMANMMNKQVVGLVENMSYFTCPDCGKEAQHLRRQPHRRDCAALRHPRRREAPDRPQLRRDLRRGQDRAPRGPRAPRARRHRRGPVNSIKPRIRLPEWGPYRRVQVVST